mgnify:CR=1 FL=1
MKLGSLKEGGRDGTLIVVSRDLTRAVRATGIAPTLQRALEDWENTAPRLNALSDALNEGDADGVFDLDMQALAAPLPRAYEFVDGSAYLPHVARVRKARGAEVPESFYVDPLMYQGVSAGFYGPRDAVKVVSEEYGIDLEAEIVVVTLTKVTSITIFGASGAIPASWAAAFAFSSISAFFAGSSISFSTHRRPYSFVSLPSDSDLSRLRSIYVDL